MMDLELCLVIRGTIGSGYDVDAGGAFLLEWTLSNPDTGKPVISDRDFRVYGAIHRRDDRQILIYKMSRDAALLHEAALSPKPTPASTAAQAGWRAAQTGRIGVWTKRLVAALDDYTDPDLRDAFHSGVSLAWKWRKTGTT